MLFTSDYDLPNSLVNCIAEDKDGMVWIATEDGLSRYNGSSFVTYKQIPGNPNSIQDNFVRCVCVDKRGHVFVGTTVGVQMFRPLTNDFTPLLINEKQGINSCNVNQLELLQDGSLVVAGEKCFTITVDENDVPHVKPNQITGKVGVLHRFFEDSNGRKWVIQHYKVCRINLEGKLVPVGSSNNHDSAFSSLCCGPDRKLYAGSMLAGLYIYNELTDKFDLVEGTESLLKVRDVKAIPGTFTLCVATDGVGVRFFDCLSHHFIVSHQFDDPFIDIASQKAHSLYISKQGEIWMALYQKGVFMASSYSVPFQYIGHRSQKYDFIGDRCVTSIIQTHSGEIWTATDNGGLYGFTPDFKVIRKFNVNTSVPNGLPSTMGSLFEDSKHNVWFGSYNQGFGTVNLQTGECDYCSFEGRKLKQISIFGYTEDSHGQLWAASMGNGILKYNEQKRQMETCLNEYSAAWSTSIYYDKKTDMIFAGTYNGVVMFKTADPKKTAKTILQKYIVNSISRVSQDVVAFSTNKGLVLYDIAKNKIQDFAGRQGLVGNTIYAAQPDREGGLWMSSANGLMRLDLKNNSLETYTMRDGLQGNEFYKNASMVSSDGRLWFGGINGITAFSPADIKKSHSSCIVRVVGVKSGENNILPLEKGEFVLPSNTSSFSVELATRPLYMTYRVVYSYRIDNGDWETLPVGVNRITFNNVGYGNHTLYTKTTIDGVDSDVTETSFMVEYPWFLRWWAIILWAMLIAFIAYILMNEVNRRRVLRDRMLQEKREKDINEGKIQFFMNLVHDLRTPITLISTPLQKLMQVDNAPERTRLYQIINRNVGRLLSLTNQIMDLRKIDRGMMEIHCVEVPVSNVIRSIVNSMNDVAETRRITLCMNDMTEENTKMWLDVDSFEKIVLNLLSNAFKYTADEGNIDVSWETIAPSDFFREGALRLCITDNGIGIPAEEKENIFKRFYQVNNEKHIKGTGIGLNLVKSLVELHHGTVGVSDNPSGKGTRFTIELPLGKDAFCPKELEVRKKDEEKIEEVAYNDDAVAERNTAKDDDGLARNNNVVQTISRKKVLIVDDDEEIRSFLCEELAALYNVVDCGDGEQAYEIISREGADLVVSDIMMPGIDGIELCKRIRNNMRTSHIPVILLTAKASDRDRLEGLQANADAYVTKPFNLQLLLTLIGNLLYRHDVVRNTYSGNVMPSDRIDTPRVQSADEKLLARIIKCINDNLSNPDLTTDDIAREVGLSRVHLFRKLKEMTNQSATIYVRNIRLTKASELLRQKKMTISDVAYAVGFRTPKNFSSAFKELFGMTPSEYMNSEE
ncbi:MULTISPECIES: ATP-binding protein [unclassified Bacteroides]|uniref:ATP-binding protein n=1 Tax=unclassified Bacteroides TaxID=2646097 RepID=UPI0004E24FED|nr:MULTISPECIES: ATP-binding protein [unclassified Bacteroides]